MYLGRWILGRLDREMRWRLAAADRDFGDRGDPGGVGRAAGRTPRRQCSGGQAAARDRRGRHFAVSFRAGGADRSGSLIRSYRVTAGATKQAGCQSCAAVAPSAAQGGRRPRHASRAEQLGGLVHRHLPAARCGTTSGAVRPPSASHPCPES